MAKMWKKTVVIGAGSALIGIGINGFIIPFHLINGGFMGVSLILYYLWGVKAGITFILLNIPVYLFALKSAPIYFVNGIMGAFISGLMIELFIPLNGIFHLPLIKSVILGAIMIGVGVGIMLRNHISPGGMDLLALLLAKWSKWNVGIIILILDLVIILSGLIILKDPNLFYSLLIISIVGLLASVITSFKSIQFYTN